jgi:hexosaminidase
MKRKLISSILFFVATNVAIAQSHIPALVPIPVLVQSEGSTIVLPPRLGIFVDDPALQSAAELLVESLKLVHNIESSLATDATTAFIRLELSSTESKTEYYKLDASASVVTISGDPAGVFYGTQTLIQLISGGEQPKLTHARIEDYPRFRWRGMHLDVARHFRSVDFVKKYIDLMARFKMNTFHWHLTEDQGWRIEIKAYPKLTEVGAWRKETMVAKNFKPYLGDGIPHSGFYTQDEIRDVVAYAAKRHITVVPEIEMPGHALAALAAYPEFACTPGPFEVATTWGVFEDVFCPTENTFVFLETVLDEVLELFPSKYIHIGGDEVPKRRWKESAEAQTIMKREGLKNEDELQSWFIRRIEKFLNNRDRLLIGWDEILEGGLAPNAAVMSWRGEAGGIEAANDGHNVVMTPSFALYFDHYQAEPSREPLAIGGFSPIEKVYAYEPIPESLDASRAHHVMGAQANVWTEYMKTAEHVEYMVFPRLMALAERVWSPVTQRDFNHFLVRLRPQYHILDQLNVNYRIPDPIGFSPIQTLADEAAVELEAAHIGGCLQYTLDGTDPAEDAYCHPSISQRIPLMDGAMATVKVVSVTATGRRSDVRCLEVKHLQMMPGLQRSGQSPGLERNMYPVSINRCSALNPESTHQTDTVEVPGLPVGISGPYAQILAGYMEIPFDGVYTISLTSDDGSILWVDGLVEIDNDGLHSTATKSAKLAFEYGLHPIKICHFEAGGGAALKLEVKNAQGQLVNIKYWR